MMFTNVLCMLPITVARSSSAGVMQSQGERAILGVFFPTDSALYSITFGTHTKMAELTEMPFGLMTRVSYGYIPYVRWGIDPPRGRGNFGGKM